MAFPTTKNGVLEITDLSFTPSVITLGEPVTMSMTMKNVSGVNLAQLLMELRVAYPSSEALGGTAHSPYYVVVGTTDKNGDPTWTSFTWANNTSRTFSFTFTPTEGTRVFDNARTASLTLFTYSPQLVYAAGGSSGAHFRDLQGANNEYLAIINKRYLPDVRCNFYRAEDVDGKIQDTDESTMLAMDAKVATAEELDSFFGATEFAHLYWSKNVKIDTSARQPNYVFTADGLSALRAGITGDTDILKGIVAELDADYYFTLVYGDAYETGMVSNFNVSEAFANVHLSGRKNGGVAFGRFSSATDEEPKFECNYPAYFYGGIALGGMKDFSTEEVDIGVKWLNGKKIYAKTMVYTGAAGNTAYSLNLPAGVEAVWLDAANSVHFNANGQSYGPNTVVSGTEVFFCILNNSGVTFLTRLSTGGDFYIRVFYTKTVDSEPYATLLTSDGSAFIDASGNTFIVEV